MNYFTPNPDIHLNHKNFNNLFFYLIFLFFFSFYSYTKASLLASIIFVLDKKTDWISAPHALVYFGIVIFMVYFKLSSILLGIHDPFLPFENLCCAIFFGGIWDSLAKILGRGQVKESEGKDVKKSN